MADKLSLYQLAAPPAKTAMNSNDSKGLKDERVRHKRIPHG